MSESNQINSIKRAFSVLETLYKSSEPMGVSALAAAHGLPKVTMFRILASLLECDAVRKDEDGKYSLGMIYVRYGERLRRDVSLNSIAEPILRDLRDNTHEAVNLGILYKDMVVNSFTLPGDSFLITSRALPLSPLHCSAMGKIFLSHMEDAEIEAYFRSDLTQRTVYTITTAAVFLKEKAEILSTHVSFDREEYEYGMFCIGAPVYSYNGTLIAAISLSGPTSRLKYRGLDHIVQLVSAAAKAISQAASEARLSSAN